MARIKNIALGIGALIIGVCGFFCVKELRASVIEEALDNTAVLVADRGVLHKFVVVVASYKNEEYYRRNLDSIFDQTYSNYRVIYVDDCSPDRTFELVSQYVRERGVEDKIEMIHNEVNLKAMRNLYTMIHSCENGEIVVVLDGDDWFADNRVLERLNQYYANDDVWMTYGQYKRYPDDQIGMCRPDSLKDLQEATFREQNWHYSHLRTFYAGLFKRIRIADLFYDGIFYNTTYDLAIMYPMMEMAREHTYFVPDVMYVYNYQTPLNDEKMRREEQVKIEAHIRKLPKYEKLQCHPKEAILMKSEDKADLVVFSYNRPMQLYAFLESLKKHVVGYGDVSVVFRSDDAFDDGYEIVKGAFSDVTFISQSKDHPEKDFKKLTMDAAFKGGATNPYILFAVDDIIITQDIDLSADIQALKNTGSYGFFYRLGEGVDYCYSADVYQGVPELLPVEKDAYIWGFYQKKGDWGYPNSLDFVLYDKQLIQNQIEAINFRNPNYLEGDWSRFAPFQALGLCHKEAKLVNIPVNVVSPTHTQSRSSHVYEPLELNELFVHGLKIDIEEFSHVKTKSAHVELEFSFIPQSL